MRFGATLMCGTISVHVTLVVLFVFTYVNVHRCQEDDGRVQVLMVERPSSLVFQYSVFNTICGIYIYSNHGVHICETLIPSTLYYHRSTSTSTLRSMCAQYKLNFTFQTTSHLKSKNAFAGIVFHCPQDAPIQCFRTFLTTLGATSIPWPNVSLRRSYQLCPTMFSMQDQFHFSTKQNDIE